MLSTLRPLLAYAALFLTLFAPLPFRGELPGNNDTLLAIALANVFSEKLRLLLGGASGATVLYPTPDFLAYGENCFGLAGLYVFFRTAVPSDIWAYYFFIGTLCCLSSFAVFKYATLFVRSRLVAFLSGLSYSLAGFTLGNIDDPNVIFVFFPILSLYFLERGVREGRRAHLTKGVLLAGAQIWFGLYVFLFQLLAIVIFGLVRFKELRRILDGRSVARLAVAYAALTLPLALVYYVNHRSVEIKEPHQNEILRQATSLAWQHFGNVAPNGLIYSSERNRYPPGQNPDWSRIRTACFPGFAFLAFALLGMYAARGRRSGVVFAVFLVFLLLSLGDNFPPFRHLVELPLGRYLRVPSRFYLFALVGLSVFFAVGVERAVARIPSRLRNGRVAAILVLAAIFVAENVPFPLPGYEYSSVIEPPQAYREFFRSALPKRSIVLDLPSSCCVRPGDRPTTSERLWFYNRELIYMNWQSYHKQIVVGGLNAYIPESRVAINNELQRVPAPDALEKLREIGVEYVVFHKNLILSPEENTLPEMMRSSGLRLISDTSELSIFALLAAS